MKQEVPQRNAMRPWKAYDSAVNAAINIGLFSNSTLNTVNYFCDALANGEDYQYVYTVLMNKLRLAGLTE